MRDGLLGDKFLLVAIIHALTKLDQLSRVPQEKKGDVIWIHNCLLYKAITAAGAYSREL